MNVFKRLSIRSKIVSVLLLVVALGSLASFSGVTLLSEVNRRLTRVIDVDTAKIKADPHQMRQLFQNLIGNALKFCGKKQPVVTVTADLTPDNGHKIVERHGSSITAKSVQGLRTTFTVLLPVKQI